MRYLFLLLATVAFIGCKPQPVPDLPDDLPESNTSEMMLDDLPEPQPDLPDDLPELNTTEMMVLDDLGDEFYMAPPSFVQTQEEKMLGKFLWEKCLPPYENGEKPVLPASVQ